MRTVSFLIRKDILTKLDYYCRQHAVNRSAIIRQAVAELLKNETITPISIPSFYPFEPLRRISVKFPEELIEKAEEVAVKSRISVSDIIRTAVFILTKDIKIEPEEEKKIETTCRYWCPFCGMTFAKKFALKIHLRRIHHGLPYCPVCLEPFKSPTPTNHFKRFRDPLHQFWYNIIRKRHSPVLAKVKGK